MHASLGGGGPQQGKPLPTLPLTDSLAQIGDLKSWVGSLFTGVLRPFPPLFFWKRTCHWTGTRDLTAVGTPIS